MTLQVELVSPERILWTGEADMVIARTVGGGDIAFLSGHAPFVGALDIGKVAAALDAEGWLVGRQQEPDGIHLHLNPIHREVAGEYVEAVARAVAAARGGQNSRIGANERTY